MRCTYHRTVRRSTRYRPYIHVSIREDLIAVGGMENTQIPQNSQNKDCGYSQWEIENQSNSSLKVMGAYCSRRELQRQVSNKQSMYFSLHVLGEGECGWGRGEY